MAKKKVTKRSSVTKKKDLRKYLLIVGAVALFLAFLGIKHIEKLNKEAIYKSQQPYSDSYNPGTPTLTPTPADENTPLFTGTFKKRQYKQDFKIFNKINLPSEMASLSDDMLIGMDCTPEKYQDRTKNPIILSLAKKINPQNFYFNRMVLCKTETGKYILYYGLRDEKSQNMKQAIVEVSSDLKEITPKVTFPDRDPGYFPCGYPMMLTRNNEYYYSCGGGDIMMYLQIYKVSLDSNQKPVEIIFCTDDSAADTPPAHKGVVCN